jgi:cell division septal protein FtsQ
MVGLEDLKKRLYRKKESFKDRSTFPDLVRPRKASTMHWETKENKPKRKFSRIFWGAIITLVLLMGGLLFVFLSGFPSFLQIRSVDIEITGEEKVKSGANIFWDVKLTNTNNISLRDVGQARQK